MSTLSPPEKREGSSQEEQDTQSQGRDQHNTCSLGAAEEHAQTVQKILTAGLQCCWEHCPEQRHWVLLLGARGSKMGGEERPGEGENSRGVG